MRWLLKAAGFPLALVPSVALPLLLVAAADDRGSGEAVEKAYRALPELPAAAPADSVEDLEAAAVELAARLRAVPLAEGGEELCAADKLTVSWTEPGDDYGWGAHVEPVGPAPTAVTTSVNGVVVCQGAPYAFMGFEAWRTDGDWRLAAVPYVHEEHEEGHAAPAAADAHGDHGAHAGHADEPVAHAPKPAPPAPVGPSALSLQLPTGAIEGYAGYEPQRLCDPTPKPGTLALRNLLLGNNPGTRNLGISRSCGAGGQSEHKEGRALDWGVLVSRPAEKAAAERFIGQLMATDDQGNRHAMARRMGVMYVIWNRQIWSSYRPSAGWRPYGGASPHTDHVHISLSWAGAQGRTSFWSGKVDPSTLLAFQPPPSGGSGGAPSPGGGDSGSRGTTVPVGALPTEAVREAVKDGEGKGRRGRHARSGLAGEHWEQFEDDTDDEDRDDDDADEHDEADADERDGDEHEKKGKRGRGNGRWHRDDDVLAVRTAEQAKHDADVARAAAEEAQRQAEETARAAAEEAKRQADEAARQAAAPSRGRGNAGGNASGGARAEHVHAQPEAKPQKGKGQGQGHGKGQGQKVKAKDKAEGKGRGAGKVKAKGGGKGEAKGKGSGKAAGHGKGGGKG